MSTRFSWVGVAGGLAATALLVGCDLELLADKGKRAWTENVRLDDRSLVGVERTVKFDTSNSSSGDTYSMRERDATLAFTGSLASLPVWRAPRMALVLYKDRENDQWVIVATTTSCDIWERSGKPKPSYWEYRLIGNAWQQVPLSQASIGRKTNLYTDYDHMRRTFRQTHVFESEVQRLNNDLLRGRKFREIWGDPDMYTCGEGNPGKVR